MLCSWATVEGQKQCVFAQGIWQELSPSKVCQVGWCRKAKDAPVYSMSGWRPWLVYSSALFLVNNPLGNYNGEVYCLQLQLGCVRKTSGRLETQVSILKQEGGKKWWDPWETLPLLTQCSELPKCKGKPEVRGQPVSEVPALSPVCWSVAKQPDLPHSALV